MRKRFALPLFCLLFAGFCNAIFAQSDSGEIHRPLLHFSPERGWMNDPNGLVFHNGTYHLFYQFYPTGNKWGPMHWGHATSTNLLRWQHQAIALYPDSLGYIFSGSAVVDVNNTSGLGKGGKAPLVAMFTYHDAVGEKAGKIDYQTQGLAYSNDDGKTWTKYEHNPVLKNPGIIDFRDPKVSWYEAGKYWLLTLAVKDHIEFFRSPDLKQWEKLSAFGATIGAHGGVWECPDLFPIMVNGKTQWVLLVSINPGGPNGGSVTQYFVGGFDGKTFTPQDTITRWMDEGPDNYAGVTFSNTGNRRILMGWMSNWLYGQDVPTYRWRSAMTLPRELGLVKQGNKYLLTSQPSAETAKLETATVKGYNTAAFKKALENNSDSLFRFDIEVPAKDFNITFSNDLGQELSWGYEASGNRMFVDRSQSGETGFQADFTRRIYAVRKTDRKSIRLTCIVDRSAMEIFADDGLTAMTVIYFPGKAFTQKKWSNGFSVSGNWRLSAMRIP